MYSFKSVPGGSAVKNLPAMQEMWVQSLVWEDPWRNARQPTQYPCLENPMDRGAWWATVHGVIKSQLKRLNTYSFKKETLYHDCKEKKILP